MMRIPEIGRFKITRNRLIVATLLFAVASGVRVSWVLHYFGPDGLGSTARMIQDETEYEGLALQILHLTGGYRQQSPRQGLRELPRIGEPTAFRTPGLPIILAGIYGLVGDHRGAVRISLVLLTSLIAPVLYFLLLLLFDSALVATALGCAWAFFPTSIKFAGLFLGEEIATLLLLLVVVLTIVAAHRGSRRLAAAAGLLVGFAIMTRGFLLFVPLPLAIWLLIKSSRSTAVWFAVAAVVIPAGWMLRNISTLKVFSLSTETPEVLWLGNCQWARGSWPGGWAEQHSVFLKKYPDFDRLDEIGQYHVFAHEAKSEILSNPGRTLWLLPRKAAIFFSPKTWMGTDPIFALALPLFVLGGYFIWRDRAARHWLVLVAAPIGAVLVINLMAYSDVRHRHPIDPLIMILAGGGLAHLVAMVRHRSARPLVAPKE